MEEKIKQWEDEIVRITEKQKEQNQRCNDKVRELRKKIQEAEQERKLLNNQMIAEAVREIYGNVDERTLDMFKQQIRQLKESKGERLPVDGADSDAADRL